ncbi:FadR/GntR family transcriptional regulator [Salinibacillus xinjiangensis]|uniref:GntR family transcriptional regulator n=1 Tax=Salinibacillus xinjiangensis TaxID=1229268 RepID=A0A6G1X9R7_9BACI|nr:GntR family transcriptional regulator [Salinibacillus xinjiangensis]MRG87687.1 GntR family transcriptional regulator [Salinibacillus xinjiangensis]
MSNQEKAKVYQEVLEQIRQFIDENKLSPGDRLPSERYLSETLNAGRSSVREALRAIELLGIIETKHGEGTFLKEYRPFNTVSLLSTFILHESKTKEELLQVKMLLEQSAARLAMECLKEDDCKALLEITRENRTMNERHFYFFYYLLKMSGNQLFLKIWQLVEEFTRTVHNIDYDKSMYENLIMALKNKKQKDTEKIILQLYKL